MPEQKFIEIRGAREHNLKSIDIDIPRDRLVVITGLSGSGKSSLAFDTIYAEGQRRYVESLSAYARQFLDMMQKPDVDHITGLSPAISIEQKTTSKNPRSTVGTVTEIYDYLRLLFARVGTPYSPATGLPIEAQQVSQMVDITMALPEGTRAYLLAPIVRDRKGEYRKEFQDLRKQGFQRVKVNGAFHDLDAPPELDKKYRHNVDVVVDRIVVREGLETRLADSLRTALDLADGIAILEIAPPADETGDAEEPRRITFSENFACPVSGFTIPEIEPRLFSFNAPFGACPACDGLGVELFFDPRLVVPDESLPLLRGAIAPWAKGQSPYFRQTIEALAKHYGFDKSARWRDLPERAQQVLLYGSEGEKVRFRYDEGGRVYEISRPFEGVIPNLERRYRETDSRLVARGDGALPEQPPLRHLPRLPAEARGAGGQDRRPPRRRGRPHVDPRGAGLGRDGAREPDRAAKRDRPRDPQGDPRAARLPGQRRPRLPDAGAQRRHPLRRREPAHPAGLADRLRADRRALRARRAVDRPAPARQRPPADHAEEPARRRQHGDRRRARRGGDPRGRPRHRHRPRRRRARRRDHRRRARRRTSPPRPPPSPAST